MRDIITRGEISKSRNNSVLLNVIDQLNYIRTLSNTISSQLYVSIPTSHGFMKGDK